MQKQFQCGNKRSSVPPKISLIYLLFESCRFQILSLHLSMRFNMSSEFTRKVVAKLLPGRFS